MARWQDEESPKQWEQWQYFALRIAIARNIRGTYDAADYAANAIEKLLSQTKKPENVEAWLRTTINNLFIDRYRKVQRRGGETIRGLDGSDLFEREMISFACGSPSALVYVRESVSKVLAVLNEKEREMLILSVAGFDNHEIADHFSYGNNKIVATRLAQIIDKVQKSVATVGQNNRPK